MRCRNQRKDAKLQRRKKFAANYTNCREFKCTAKRFLTANHAKHANINSNALIAVAPSAYFNSRQFVKFVSAT